MDMHSPLLPEIPLGLDGYLRAHYSDETLARRAMLAPWPWLSFASAWDERELWRDTAANSPTAEQRRSAFESALSSSQNPSSNPIQILRLDQPFFPAPDTGGTLRSPYSQLSDSDYWCFVSLWDSEKRACEMLEKWRFSELGNRSSLKFLEHARRKSWLGETLAKLRKKRDSDPRLTVWDAHFSAWVQETFPNYL